MKGCKNHFVFTFLSVLSLFHYLPVYAEICNRIVAYVNDEVITLHELDERIKELTGITASDLQNQDKEAYLETRRKVLDLLIDEKIAQEKIKELGIVVDSKAVDSAIESIKKRNHWTHEDLIAGLAGKGVSLDQYREQLKKELEQLQLIDFEVKSKIIVRDETIKKYYDDHIDEFRTEERVRLALILLVQEDRQTQDGRTSLFQKAQEIISMVKNGEDFGEMARRYSQVHGAENGGDLGFIQTSQLDPRLKEMVNNMSMGDVSEAIISPSTIQIIKVIEKQPKGIQPIEEVKTAIYDILYKKEISEKYSTWISGLKEKAYIKIVF